jgi:hypothetical protein
MKLDSLFLFSFLMWSCSEEKNSNEVASCVNKDGLIKVSALKSVSGVVKKSDISGSYLIYEKEPNEFGNHLPLVPCNLPNNFELENLVIKFSGNLMETESWEFSDHEAQPFEITYIDLVEGQ